MSHDFCPASRCVRDQGSAPSKCQRTYPPALLQFIKTACYTQSRTQIADIGCGTGTLSELMLAEGNDVIGIEPSTRMRNAAVERLNLKYSSTFSTLVATPESTLLDSHSIDLITCSTAFHWYNVQRTRREWKRILRPGGHVVLLWTEWHVCASEFMHRFEDLVARNSSNFQVTSESHDDHSVVASQLFGDHNSSVHSASFLTHQIFDLRGLRACFESSSHSPHIDTQEHAYAIANLEQLFDRFQENGVVRFVHRTIVYAGTL